MELEEVTEEKKTLAGLLFVLCSIPLSIYQAFVFSALWGWFIVPLGAPALTIPLAYGLTLLIGFIKPSKSPEYAEYLKTWLEGLIYFSLTLGIGKIVSLFV